MPTRRAALFALAASAAASGIQAQEFPSKPVRIVVPFAAGGGVDIVARVLAETLGPRLGQTVVVDNRAGAAGNLGVDAVAKAPPDGHTLVMATTGTHTINPGLYAKLPFDAEKDFKPITLVASVPNLLVVHPSLGVDNAAGLVALAKSRPGQLAFASFGNGASNHLSGEMLKTLAGIQATHVPYKNAPQAVTDLIGGQVQFAFVNMPLALPHVKAGKLKALAVTGVARSAAAPEFPTMAEAGVPGFVVESWYGLLAPAGTPDAVVAKLHRETLAALATPQVKAAFAQQGADVMTSTDGASFAALMKSERQRWADVIKASGAKVD
jgi:tripartite-type tricarboxylate transporter receptor subunit TctC